MTRKLISFIVPAHNEEAWISRCLSAIGSAMESMAAAHEVIVADDASTDATAAIAVRHGARVVRIAHRQISATRNAGAMEAAFARTAELSVYIQHDHHRRGYGRAIMAELLARGRALDYHALIGGCCAESAASIGLLEAFDFARVGHFPEVGREFDRWLDVIFLQLLL